MICMVWILARIPPSQVHDPRGQINNHRIDRFFSIHWIGIILGVIANRVWEIQVIALNRLQRLDAVFGGQT